MYIECRIKESEKYKGGKRGVKICGEVRALRMIGGDEMKLIVRDGSGFVQCEWSGDLARCYDSWVLKVGSEVRVYGEIRSMSGGVDRSVLKADYWELVGGEPGDTPGKPPK